MTSKDAKAKAEAMIGAIGDEDLGVDSAPAARQQGREGISGGAGEYDETQAAKVLALAQGAYRFVRSPDGRNYAVPRSREPGGIAIPFGKRLQGKLLQLYYADEEAIPQIAAVRAAEMLLAADLADAEPEPVHLRVAWHGGQVIIDLGWRKPACIIAGADGWKLAEKPPVIFRRSGTSQPMPEPVRGEGKDSRKLRDLLNCDESTYRLLVGFVIAAWIERIPHPILALFGEQGSAKSMCAWILCMLISPDSTPKRSAIKDPSEWAVCAYASYAFILDNISSVEQWLSDALCKASTGDGLLKRTLYTDDDVTALSFRRVVALTSLDLGAAPGDLTERLLPAVLDRIQPAKRRTEFSVIGHEDLAGILDTFAIEHPAIFGMLLDLLCLVLARLPEVDAGNLPRMADFAVVLRALDAATGWQTAADYDRISGNATAALVENSPFGVEIRKLMEKRTEWEGTTTELLDCLSTQAGVPPRGWPGSPAAAGKLLTKLAPSLRGVGIEVTQDRDKARRTVRIERVADLLSLPSPEREKALSPAETPVTGATGLLSPVTGAAVTGDGGVTGAAVTVTGEPGAAVTSVIADQAPGFQDHDRSDSNSPTRALEIERPSPSVAGDDQAPAPSAPVLGTAGPCRHCGQPCTRYGADGSPLCDRCRGELAEAGAARLAGQTAAGNGQAPQHAASAADGRADALAGVQASVMDAFLREAFESRHGPPLPGQWRNAESILREFIGRHGLKDAWRVARYTADNDCGMMWQGAPVTVARFLKSHDPGFADVILAGQERNQP